MKVIMFIPFLIATVSAHSQFMNSLMFRDPEAFVATFANADHDAINKVLEMVNEMMEQGEAEVATAKANYESARATADAARIELKDATNDLTFKKGELEFQTQAANSQQEYVNLKKNEEETALADRNAARSLLEEHQAFLKKDSARIASEREVLERIAEILDDLKANKVPEGRRLLSVPSQASFLATLASQGLKVDPEAVEKVLFSIAKLISDGQELLEQAQGYVTDSTAALEKDEKTYSEAITCHVEANNALTDVLAKQKIYEEAVEAAESVHSTAKDASTSADNSATEADKKLSAEAARVKGENQDLLRVKELLKGLL